MQLGIAKLCILAGIFSVTGFLFFIFFFNSCKAKLQLVWRVQISFLFIVTIATRGSTAGGC